MERQGNIQINTCIAINPTTPPTKKPACRKRENQRKIQVRGEGDTERKKKTQSQEDKERQIKNQE